MLWGYGDCGVEKLWCCGNVEIRGSGIVGVYCGIMVLWNCNVVGLRYCSLGWLWF